jgi:PilZ domain
MDERRRYPRFTVENIHGRLIAESEVDILNMSISGAAIKVERRLAMGAHYNLKLDRDGAVIGVETEVVWSVLTEFRKGDEGEEVPVYSAGLKFLDVLTPRIAELLSFIDEHKIIDEKRLGGLRMHIDAPGKASLDYPEGYQVLVLSRTGMLIETHHVVTVDGICAMEITLPGGGESLRFSGRVVTVKEGSDEQRPRREIGIEFVDMPEADGARLAKYLEKL